MTINKKHNLRRRERFKFIQGRQAERKDHLNLSGGVLKDVALTVNTELSSSTVKEVPHFNILVSAALYNLKVERSKKGNKFNFESIFSHVKESLINEFGHFSFDERADLIDRGLDELKSEILSIFDKIF